MHFHSILLYLCTSPSILLHLCTSTAYFTFMHFHSILLHLCTSTAYFTFMHFHSILYIYALPQHTLHLCTSTTYFYIYALPQHTFTFMYLHSILFPLRTSAFQVMTVERKTEECRRKVNNRTYCVQVSCLCRYKPISNSRVACSLNICTLNPSIFKAAFSGTQQRNTSR